MCVNHDEMVFIHNPAGVVREVAQREHHWLDQPRDAVHRGALFVDNLIPGMAEIAATWATHWRSEYRDGAEVVEVPHSRPVDESLLSEISRSGVALVGLGNCGACTTWLSELAAELSECMPAAVVVTERFEPAAHARLRALGEPTLPVVALPNDAPTAAGERLDSIISEASRQLEKLWRLEGAGSQ